MACLACADHSSVWPVGLYAWRGERQTETEEEEEEKKNEKNRAAIDARIMIGPQMRINTEI